MPTCRQAEPNPREMEEPELTARESDSVPDTRSSTLRLDSCVEKDILESEKKSPIGRKSGVTFFGRDSQFHEMAMAIENIEMQNDIDV